MKNSVWIIAGLLFIVVAMIVPLPAMLAVPAGVWRAAIGVLGCGLLVFGIQKGKH